MAELYVFFIIWLIAVIGSLYELEKRSKQAEFELQMTRNTHKHVKVVYEYIYNRFLEEMESTRNFYAQLNERTEALMKELEEIDREKDKPG